MNIYSCFRAFCSLLSLVCVSGDITREDNFFEGEFSNNHKGRMLRVLMVFNKLALDKCVVKCIQHIRCKTVNYNFKKEKCELTDVDFNDDEADRLSYDWYNYGTPSKVDGAWGAWRNVTRCSATCGGGTMNQARDCDSPTPQHGGDDCIGKGERTIDCNAHPCPVNGNWSSWENDTSCNATCGGGSVNQTRKCDSPKPAHGGKDCNGTAKRTITCNNHTCTAVVGNWGAWTDESTCTVKCGGGYLRQKRLCNSPKPERGGKDCNGASDKEISCNTHLCPVHGGWGHWKITSVCNDHCDGGTYTKTRECDSPAPLHGGITCRGVKTESLPCTKTSCPVNNIALHKTASQSGGSYPSKGNDGNLITRSSTGYKESRWWQVDLETNVQIEYILILVPSTSEKSDMKVLGRSATGYNFEPCKDPVHFEGDVAKFSCDSNQRFRYIRVEQRQKEKNYLSIVEFEVYTKKN